MKLKMNKKWKDIIIVMTAIFMLSMGVLNTTILNIPVITNESPSMSIGPPYSAALMVGGDETDLGFSYVGIQAINMLKDDYDWDISISSLVAFPDQSGIASGYGDDGYDVIFFIGGQFIETSYFDVAFSYNETLFVQIPGLNPYAPTPDNLVGLHPAFQTEGFYLAGVLAGLMTETNSLGVVFGEWYEYLSMEFFAFKAGAESVNDDVCVFVRVAGTWGDAALGKQITETLISSKNVDIVVNVADTTGRGVISAAIAADIAVIGTVADQSELAPYNMLTSIGMDTSLLMELVAQYVENGTAMSELGGTSWDIPIGNYLYSNPNWDDYIPQSVKDQVDDAKAGIADGSIVVPRIWEGEEEPPPADPTDCPTDDEADPIDIPTPPDDEVIPGFPLLYLALATTTMLGVMLLLVNRSRRIVNKHKS